MLPEPGAREPRVAAPAVVGGCRVLAGASSWADRSLVKHGSFYPSRSLNAAGRLAYYATRLPLAEAATTYRFPPTPELARRWAVSVPEGFKFDLRAWSLLSGAPTWQESLWPDLLHHVRPSRRESSKLYRDRLPAEVVDECWARFRHALAPLEDAGVLGTVIFRYPSWFSPRPAACEELAALPARMGGARVAVELSSGRWFEGDGCEQTFGLLEELGIALVCRAAPGLELSSVVAATADHALLRFTPAAPWQRHRYSHAELSAWLPAVRELASCTSEVHVIMDNCWCTDAVDNASSLLSLLGQEVPTLF